MELLTQVMRRDPEIREELAERNETGSLPGALKSGVPREEISRAMEGAAGEAPAFDRRDERAEAVVLFEGRPSLLIRDDTFEQPVMRVWRARLAASAGLLERAIPSVGRIELFKHPLSSLVPMIGTGWMIAEDVLVTNRHVASFFGFREGGRFSFRADPGGGNVEIRVDFREEEGLQDMEEFDIAEIKHIEDDRGLDFAFLRVSTSPGRPLGQPLVLGSATSDEIVATIGYPGPDPRVPETKIRDIFRGIYRVKRLAPGMIMSAPANGVFDHDCSTLKGSSGSVVVSLDSGMAVGLHFAGEFGLANSAVAADQLKERLAAMRVSVPVDWVMPAKRDEAEGEGLEAREAPANRAGYDQAFLGEGFEVALPGLDFPAAQVTADGGKELKYTHYSVVMHQERKLAISTGVNIDGGSLRVIPRGDDWRLDSRIPDGQQHGNELYRQNDYDRGHMVRRLDPVWGELETARQANDDTFFYTNAAPQHKDLNQKLWLQLEEYVLDNANAHDLRISVFTGPVFDPGDPLHRGVKIPRQFWKVVAFIDGDSGELCASGYLLDQSHLIIDVPAEFAFGAFKTFQVSIDLIARLTQLNFGNLVAADVLGWFESAQSLPLSRLQDIVLNPRRRDA